MIRLLSLLLVALGIAAVSYGGYRYMQTDQISGQSEAGVPDSPFTDSFGPSDASASMPEPRSVAGPSSAIGLDDMIGTESVSNDFLSTLQSVPIAHETPTKAQFGRPFEVTVAIDATGDDSAADALPGRGEIVEGMAKISADVQATLSGDKFEISAVTPMIQSVSPLTENIWRWNVTPLEAGPQSLTIELFALNGERALPVRTFRDEVEVRVSRLGQAIATANSLSPIAVVIGGVGSLLAGLLGLLRLFRKS